ncbi:MAG: pyridoxal-phosphate dependent enzyme [Pseudomonadota bacterium]
MHRLRPAGYNYLFERYPLLGRRLARIHIGCYPTPLQSLEPGLWIKRDDYTHRVYGGNKVRKLEFLFGQALQRGCESVVTFGGVGSNHALATALHARRHELGATAMLMPQRYTEFVDATLARHQSNQTHLTRWSSRRTERIDTLRALRDAARGKLAVVPLGGTSAVGSIGYVNAAFELAAQWPQQLARPTRIYVAAGTMGTAAGLAVGLQLLNWPTAVIAVQVTVASQVNNAAMDRLCRKIGRRLRAAERGIPAHIGIDPAVEIRSEYLGTDYADPTSASQSAVSEARSRWQLPLETTYTGKAMACLIAEQASRKRAEQWLFWHTYSGSPAVSSALSEPTGEYADYRQLLHHPD